jgi:hypothetical protein
MGPFIVTVVGLLVPLNDPNPIPDQLLNTKLGFGVAEIPTPVPMLYQPLGGLTVPFVPAFIVKKYCVVKFAV